MGFFSVFLWVLPFSFPKCFCEYPYPHLEILPRSMVFAYIGFLVVLILFVASCFSAILAVFKERAHLLTPFLLVIGLMWVGMLSPVLWSSDILSLWTLTSSCKKKQSST